MSSLDMGPATHSRDAAPRVCPKCGSPVAADDPSEYTAARAALILERGLCLCPPHRHLEPND